MYHPENKLENGAFWCKWCMAVRVGKNELGKAVADGSFNFLETAFTHWRWPYNPRPEIDVK